MLPHNPELTALIDKLWNRFWSGGISNPLSAIEQITYLLFMKQIDELDHKREQEARDAGKTFKSCFHGSYVLPQFRTQADALASAGRRETVAKKKIRQAELKRLQIDKSTLRWSSFKKREANDMLLHVQEKVFPFIKEFKGEGSALTRHMANAVFLIPSAPLLHGAVAIIEDIFTEMAREARQKGHLFQDIQGDVYEMLLAAIGTAGKNGQFRTPRHIIKLVSELVKPKLGDRICDPACGTAGFLLDAWQYLTTQLAKQNAGKKRGNTQNFAPDGDGFIRASFDRSFTQDEKDILEQNLCGYDFDATMVRLAIMNLMMHGIDNPRVDYKDTLSKSFTEKGEYDIVMANPPFTGSVDKSDLNELLKLPTTKTELLYIERIFTLLKSGGTAGIIIPQGVLFGASNAFIAAREKLVEQAELKAVITLPGGVFKPYAGVATAILIFTRGSKTKHTWFYNVAKDGYSLDDRRKPQRDVEDRLLSDLPAMVLQWNARNPKQPSNRNANHFFVPVQEIRDNAYDLSFNRYRKDEHAETTFEEPKVILKKMKELEDRIQEGIAELEGILE